MTTEQFQKALGISDEDLPHLKTLSESLAKFDEDLAAKSPDAHKIGVAAAKIQWTNSCQLMSKTLGIPVDEVYQHMQGLVGSPNGYAVMTTATMTSFFIE